MVAEKEAFVIPITIEPPLKFTGRLSAIPISRLQYDMDKISGLPDDLLVKILSFVPTKVAVTTCVLSKRWEFLWMCLPKLVFNNSRIKSEDIKRWIDIAVSRYVRELEIDYFSQFQNLFPSSFFTCKSLVTLKLTRVTLMDVPSITWLPSLKNLQLILKRATFVDGNSLQRLLSGCPVLEDLSVNFFYHNDLTKFTIIIPSLQRLSLDIKWNLDGYVIITPSLKYLKLVDRNLLEHYALIENMPKLREAYVDVGFANPNTFIRSITSVKSLTICGLEGYGDGCVFKELEHLNLCVCENDSSKFLDKLLKDSPKLRVLDISVMKGHGYCNGMVCWNQPTSVPECLLSSLQTFKWSGYSGRPQHRDIAVYILKNARHLKKATILTDTRFVPKLQMIKELTLLSPRASRTSQLVFV